MRCYIDEPYEALQIPGMMASIFQQIKNIRHVYNSIAGAYGLNQTVEN